MKDITTREDIENLVNRFYQKVEKDAEIGFFFTEIAKVDWDQHLPKMYNFWETLMFGQPKYKGNPMAAHFPINEMAAMEKKHFEHWLSLWTSTVEELYEGENAKMAVNKAQNIANLMAFKMEKARDHQR